ncbi:MAG: YihY/virulence factor BrkB family protein [Clostridiaceae bacterium]
MKNKFCFSSFFSDLRYRILDDDIMALSSYLSYALLISFFPFLIFLLTVIGLFPIGDVSVLGYLSSVLPKSVYDFVYKIINEILETSSINLLSFSVLITLYTSSRGFRAVIKGLNRAYDESEKRSVIKVQLLSILFTLGIIFIILVSFFLQIFSLQLKFILEKYLKYTRTIEYTSIFSRYFLLSISLICIFAFIYKYTPSRKIRWFSVLPGALFSTISWVICSLGFSFYINNFSNYSKLYGSIAAIFILLTWLFISSAIILIGGEINAAICFVKEGRNKPRCKNY